MNIKTIGVVGAGTMGNGIAQVCAAAGLKVIMQDIGDAQVERGLSTIAGSLDRLIKKEKISAEDRQSTLSNISTTTQLADLAEVDVVVEAATENEALKLDIFRQLDNLCKPTAILASNTSSISLTRIAGVTERAQQVVGMHFMNPVPMMALVEVIRALQTSDEVYQQIHELSEFIGKVPVEAKDSPGFVANRILIPMINEAAYVYYEGLASAEGIDEIMKLGMAHPMGPLMLADLIGLDTCYAVIKVLHEGFGDSKYRPCPIWQQMVDAGYLGRKSGRGFYNYEDQ
ncbi:MAG: 3-hydroxybutyryl-CoA dehydrogenase [Gammaproteobacteria bacterium]|nr:3-hydroxybutyryl-CoA dehydrogenase [Gammaproteobacteria bacterium]